MKKISDSRSQQIHILRYQHLNGQRRMFGGILMQWIDEMAGIVAARHTGNNVITAAVDSLVFKEPGFLNDLIVLEGQVTYIGKTSMEVRVDTYRMQRGVPGGDERHLINQAYLVMVSTDDEGNPVPIPPIQLETDEERQEWEMGQKRYDLRKQRRKEQY